jgi:hypothetical protein
LAVSVVLSYLQIAELRKSLTATGELAHLLQSVSTDGRFKIRAKSLSYIWLVTSVSPAMNVEMSLLAEALGASGDVTVIPLAVLLSVLSWWLLNMVPDELCDP